MKRFPAVVLFFLFLAQGFAQGQETPYTLEDRERLIRIESRMDVLEARMDALEVKMDALEMKMDALEMKMDARFDLLNARIDTLFWLVGLLFGMMTLMFGYLVWDRRTALKPAIEKAAMAENMSKQIICALHDYAHKDDRMKQSLKTYRLM